MTFDPELGELICDLIADGEKSLSEICRLPHMPYRGTILRWVMQGETGKSEELKEFAICYTQAMNIRAAMLIDDTVPISDYMGNDFRLDSNGVQMFDDAGNPIIDHDNIQRAKLRIETRMKFAAIVAPRKYGVKHVEQKTESTNTNLNLNVDYELTGEDMAMLERLKGD